MVWDDPLETRPLRASWPRSGIITIDPISPVVVYDEHPALDVVETEIHGSIEINCLGIPHTTVGVDNLKVAALMGRFFQEIASSYGFRL